MGLSEGIAWSIIATQNLGIVLWNNWLPESIAHVMPYIIAVIVAVIIIIFMNNDNYNFGGLFLGGLIGAVISGIILRIIYNKKVKNRTGIV